MRLLNPVFNYLILLAALIPFAKLCGKKVICFCVGIGPLDTPLGRRITRMICERADEIMVREESSRELLLGIGHCELRDVRIGARRLEGGERALELGSRNGAVLFQIRIPPESLLGHR